MAKWIVRTQGEYPHLLPHLVDQVISKKRLDESRIEWLVEMSDQTAAEVRGRRFVESLDPVAAPVSVG